MQSTSLAQGLPGGPRADISPALSDWQGLPLDADSIAAGIVAEAVQRGQLSLPAVEARLGLDTARLLADILEVPAPRRSLSAALSSMSALVALSCPGAAPVPSSRSCLPLHSACPQSAAATPSLKPATFTNWLTHYAKGGPSLTVTPWPTIQWMAEKV